MMGHTAFALRISKHGGSYLRWPRRCSPVMTAPRTATNAGSDNATPGRLATTSKPMKTGLLRRIGFGQFRRDVYWCFTCDGLCYADARHTA